MFTHLSHDAIGRIAARYGESKLFDKVAMAGWVHLGATALTWRSRIEALGTRVSETRAENPYANVHEMFDDIRLNNCLLVSSANCDHPVWTPTVNIAFRVWHDMCHYKTGGDFELAGELAACSRQAVELLDTWPRSNALSALYTECIGQLAYRIVYGKFGPQKVVYLPME